MTINPSSLTPASIQWEGDVLASTRYGDVYYSKKGGIEESRYVFLQGNGLPSRWQTQKKYVIMEAGFGTGRNFLVTCQAFFEANIPGASLCYYAIEKHPLPLDVLTQVLTPWHVLTPYANGLLAHYPPLVPGRHTIVFPYLPITLVLLWGDVEDMLKQMAPDEKAHSWYLDGFAPAKNPEMWGAAVCRQVAAHTHSGGYFATYTAASSVRIALEKTGFNVYKRNGFNGKRHMLYGMLP